MAQDIGYKVRMSYKRPRDALRGLDLEKDHRATGFCCWKMTISGRMREQRESYRLRVAVTCFLGMSIMKSAVGPGQKTGIGDGLQFRFSRDCGGHEACNTSPCFSCRADHKIGPPVVL